MAKYNSRNLRDDFQDMRKVLTTEEGKMYNIYILNGFTNEIEVIEDDGLFEYWYDHCVNPNYFKHLAVKHCCTYSKETFQYIVEEYNCNYLDISNITELSVNGARAELRMDVAKDCIKLEFIDKSKSFKTISELNEFLDVINHPLINPYDFTNIGGQTIDILNNLNANTVLEMKVESYVPNEVEVIFALNNSKTSLTELVITTVQFANDAEILSYVFSVETIFDFTPANVYELAVTIAWSRIHTESSKLVKLKGELSNISNNEVFNCNTQQELIDYMNTFHFYDVSHLY